MPWAREQDPGGRACRDPLTRGARSRQARPTTYRSTQQAYMVSTGSTSGGQVRPTEYRCGVGRPGLPTERQGAWPRRAPTPRNPPKEPRARRAAPAREVAPDGTARGRGLDTHVQGLDKLDQRGTSTARGVVSTSSTNGVPARPGAWSRQARPTANRLDQRGTGSTNGSGRNATRPAILADDGPRGRDGLRRPWTPQQTPRPGPRWSPQRSLLLLRPRRSPRRPRRPAPRPGQQPRPWGREPSARRPRSPAR